MTTSLASTTNLKNTLRRVPTPVAFIATHDEGPVGMLVGSFVGISLEPPLVGVFIQKTSTTWPRLKASLDKGLHLGISILGRPHAHEVRTLAGRDRFSSAWSVQESGAIHLVGSDSELTAVLEEVQDIGDHYFALLRVVSTVADGTTSALVFHQSKVDFLGGTSEGI